MEKDKVEEKSIDEKVKKLFDDLYSIAHGYTGVYPLTDEEDAEERSLKTTRQALLTQIQEIEDMVEEMKREYTDRTMSKHEAIKYERQVGFNEALSDLLSALKEKKSNLEE